MILISETQLQPPAPVHTTKNFSIPNIQPTGILIAKFQIPLRNSAENGSAVPVSIHQSDPSAVKINPELPIQRLFPRLPLIEQGLAFAFQLPVKLLFNNVPCGNIIESPFMTQPLEMVPWYPVPIPGIVYLTSYPIFPAALNSYILKISNENLTVILEEGV